jgi:hypothetical protein
MKRPTHQYVVRDEDRTTNAGTHRPLRPCRDLPGARSTFASTRWPRSSAHDHIPKSTHVSERYRSSAPAPLIIVLANAAQMSFVSGRTANADRRGSCSRRVPGADAFCPATADAAAAAGSSGFLTAGVSRACKGRCASADGRCACADSARTSRRRFACVRGFSFAASSRTRRRYVRKAATETGRPRSESIAATAVQLYPFAGPPLAAISKSWTPRRDAMQLGHTLRVSREAGSVLENAPGVAHAAPRVRTTALSRQPSDQQGERMSRVPGGVVNVCCPPLVI